MRNFIISIVCLFIMICLWTGFSLYSSHMTNELQTCSHRLVHSYINNGDWASAEHNYTLLSDTWDRYKRFAAFFLDSKDINEIDSTMKKAYLYMRAEDISNSSGEFSYLEDKFKFLYQNASVTISNIF